MTGYGHGGGAEDAARPSGYLSIPADMPYRSEPPGHAKSRNAVCVPCTGKPEIRWRLFRQPCFRQVLKNPCCDRIHISFPQGKVMVSIDN
jgi:hypothetical protein